MNVNSEENTAKYYDIIYKDWIPQEYTEWEILFFKKFVKKSGSILDVGCGSGRHIIPLHKLGYTVLGIEPLKNFVDQIKVKDSQVEVLNSNLLEAKIRGKFDLIISMWNAFHQLAYNYDEAIIILKKLLEHLNNKGNIIFSSSPLEDWNVKDYNFTHTVIENGKKYFLTWSVENYDEEENIVISRENIKVYDESDNLIDEKTAFVKQKYWSKKELESLCKELNLVYTKYPAQKGFYDNYYVITRK